MRQQIRLLASSAFRYPDIHSTPVLRVASISLSMLYLYLWGTDLQLRLAYDGVLNEYLSESFEGDVAVQRLRLV